jgi:hypothetical protein
LWWTRFVAYAIVYKFIEVIRKDVPEVDMPSNEMEALDEKDDDDKKKIATKRCNAVAIANLSMVFTSEGSMGLVYKSMTPEL